MQLTQQFVETMWFLCSGRSQLGKESYERICENEQYMSDGLSRLNLLRGIGFGFLAQGRFDDANKLWSEMQDIASDQVPDYYSVLFCRCWMSHVMVRQGRLVEAAAQAKEVFEEFVSDGHVRFAHWSLECLVQASNGQLPFDRLKSCISSLSGDNSAEIQQYCSESIWHLAQGRTSVALELADSALKRLKQTWAYNGFTTLSIAQYSRVARAHADSIATSDAARARFLRKRGLKVARWGTRVSWLMASDAAAIFREVAECYSALGKPHRGIKYARRSCQIAEDQGTRFELAKSRLCVAKLSAQLGLASSEQLIADAKEGMDKFEKMIEQNAAIWSTS